MGTYLAEKGGEVGATTGRPRRCGWLDAFLLSHTVQLNGIDGLCITKIDVLDGLETIKVCTDYSSDLSKAEILETLTLEGIEPIYTEFEGWSEDLTAMEKDSNLPVSLINYIEFLENELKIPIKIVSVGPDRKQTIFR